VLALLYFAQDDDSSDAAIPANVTVDGLPVGGQSAEEAASSLQQVNLTNQAVAMRDGDRSWSLTLAALGVAVDIPRTVQLAREAAPGADVTPWYTIDLTQTQNQLFALSDQVNIPANPPQKGRAIDIPVLLSRLYNDLQGELADGQLDLPMMEVQPPPEDTVVRYDGATTTHIVEAGQELGLIARLYGVSMDDIISMNNLTDPDLLYVGQELTIPAAGVYVPSAADAPLPSTTAGKAIVVSTQQQRIFAYENGQLIHSYLVSTGLPDTPTVLGDYSIYVKYTATDMSGPDYYLPQVPYTMYFYQGYGIHGTYWHNSFGRPMSHGCVNLPTPEAEWFFNWAEVGTPVRVV
jgi:LysM repeat protein